MDESLQENAPDEGEQKSPIEAGRPTIFVFLDEGGETQVGAANYDFSHQEIVLILGIAQAKLALLDHQIQRRAQVQEAIRQQILKGV